MRYKPSLSTKLFLSYFLLIFFSFIIGSYAVVHFNTLRVKIRQVIQVGLPLLDAGERMTKCLTLQVNERREYFVSRDKGSLSRFKSGEEEYKKYLSDFIRQGQKGPVLALQNIYDRYVSLFDQIVDGQGEKGNLEEDRLRLIKLEERLLENTQNLKSGLWKEEGDQLAFIYSLNGHSLTTLLYLSAGCIALGLVFTYFIARYFSSSLAKIKQTTQMIAKGRFDDFSHVFSGDEMGGLLESFQSMGARLKELDALHLDANPLSRLPGNLAIEKELLKRLRHQSPLAFCLIDLDNFKAYGDTYGYARGSEILTVVSGILIQAVQSCGAADDFIGHIGGDDFVLITEPGRAHTLCQRVISEFDQTIPYYYDEADRRRGYIVAKDRKDVEQQFPIMTLSIAVVTNEKRKFQDTNKIGELAAQLKQYAKTFPKSIYVIDQRRN